MPTKTPAIPSTQNDAWETYVGDDSRSAWTVEDVEPYVAGSPLCDDLTAAQRAELAVLLRAHIEAG